MRNSNTFISYTGQKWLILALAGVLLAGSVSGCGSLGAGNPRQEMQQETQESLSGTQENSAGHTAGRTDGERRERKKNGKKKRRKRIHRKKRQRMSINHIYGTGVTDRR